MKRFLAFLLASVFLFTVTSCTIQITTGKEETSSQQSEEETGSSQTTPPFLAPVQGNSSTSSEDLTSSESSEPVSSPGSSVSSEPSVSSEETSSGGADVFESWIPLIGYWHAADGRFFLLDMADSHSAYFEEGIWDTGFNRGGYITELSLIDPMIHQGTVHYPAVEGTEMDDPQPARDVSLTVDWINLDNDGKIRIVLDGETFYCAYAGMTRDEAYAVHQQNMGDIADYASSIEALWTRLEGCWDANGSYFAEFSFQDGKPSFRSGPWGQPVPYGRGYGEVSSLNTFEGYYTMSLTYPPAEEAADEQDLRPLLYTLMVGISEDGTLSVDGPEETFSGYTYCGSSYEAALSARG